MATEDLIVDPSKVAGFDMPELNLTECIGLRSVIDKMQFKAGEHGPFCIISSAPLTHYMNGKEIKVGYEVRATAILPLIWKLDKDGKETKDIAWNTAEKSKTAAFLKSKGAKNLVELAQKPVIIQVEKNKKGVERLTLK